MSEEWYSEIIESSCGSFKKDIREEVPKPGPDKNRVKPMGEETEDSLRDRAWNVVVLVVTNASRAPTPNTKKFGTGKTIKRDGKEIW